MADSQTEADRAIARFFETRTEAAQAQRLAVFAMVHAVVAMRRTGMGVSAIASALCAPEERVAAILERHST